MRYGTPLACVIVSLLGIAACGGNKPPAASGAGDPSKGDAGESFAEVNPADVAELDAGTAAKAPAAPPPQATPPPPEVKDECTPVGVDFEKRARPKLKDCYATAR